MPGKKKKNNNTDNESTKRDCVPKDNKVRKDMIEVFIMENLHDPGKFEYGPIVNKNNDPIYIPQGLEEEALYLNIPSASPEE